MHLFCNNAATKCSILSVEMSAFIFSKVSDHSHLCGIIVAQHTSRWREIVSQGTHAATSSHSCCLPTPRANPQPYSHTCDCVLLCRDARAAGLASKVAEQFGTTGTSLPLRHASGTGTAAEAAEPSGQAVKAAPRVHRPVVRESDMRKFAGQVRLIQVELQPRKHIEQHISSCFALAMALQRCLFVLPSLIACCSAKAFVSCMLWVSSAMSQYSMVSTGGAEQQSYLLADSLS